MKPNPRYHANVARAVSELRAEIYTAIFVLIVAALACGVFEG
jgi:hypothetical protein